MIIVSPFDTDDPLDSFTASQTYAIIVLPNGGPDLETFTFQPKMGWRQACSIFWQVTRALAEAEELVHFEVPQFSPSGLVTCPLTQEILASRLALGSNIGE